jgi:hypothetical protein
METAASYKTWVHGVTLQNTVFLVSAWLLMSILMFYQIQALITENAGSNGKASHVNSVGVGFES